MQNFKEYTRDRQLTNVDLSFRFAISENDDRALVAREKFIVGNTLAFYRNSHQSVMQWEFGPLRGVFPVPAVYLNVPWILENWERLTTGDEPLELFEKAFGEG